MTTCKQSPPINGQTVVQENTDDKFVFKYVSLIIQTRIFRWCAYIFPKTITGHIPKIKNALLAWSKTICSGMSQASLKMFGISYIDSICKVDNDKYIDAIYSKLPSPAKSVANARRAFATDFAGVYGKHKFPIKYIYCTTLQDATDQIIPFDDIGKLEIPDKINIIVQIANAYRLFVKHNIFDNGMIKRHTIIVRHTFPRRYIIKSDQGTVITDFNTYYGIFIRVFDIAPCRTSNQSTAFAIYKNDISPIFGLLDETQFRDFNVNEYPALRIMNFRAQYLKDLHIGNPAYRITQAAAREAAQAAQAAREAAREAAAREAAAREAAQAAREAAQAAQAAREAAAREAAAREAAAREADEADEADEDDDAADEDDAAAQAAQAAQAARAARAADRINHAVRATGHEDQDTVRTDADASDDDASSDDQNGQVTSDPSSDGSTVVDAVSGTLSMSNSRRTDYIPIPRLVFNITDSMIDRIFRSTTSPGNTHTHDTIIEIIEELRAIYNNP